MSYTFQYAIGWRDIEIPDGLGKSVSKKIDNDKKALEEARKIFAGTTGFNPVVFVSVTQDGRFVGSLWSKSRLEDKLKEAL